MLVLEQRKMEKASRFWQPRLRVSATVAMEVPFFRRDRSERKAASSLHWPALAAGQAVEVADGWHNDLLAQGGELNKMDVTEMEEADTSAEGEEEEEEEEGAGKMNIEMKRCFARKWNGREKWRYSAQMTGAVRAGLETDNRPSCGTAAKPSHTRSRGDDTEPDRTTMGVPAAHSHCSSLAGVGLEPPSDVEGRSCAVDCIEKEEEEAASSAAVAAAVACMEFGYTGWSETAHTVELARTRSAACGGRRPEIHGSPEPFLAWTVCVRAGWATSGGLHCSPNAVGRLGP